MTLADLPADCTTVLTAGGNKPPTDPAEVVDLSKNAGPENDVTAVTAAPEPPKPPSKNTDAQRRRRQRLPRRTP